MEWVFREIDPKSADPNQYKGAPNPFERTCTANLFAVNVKKYPHAGAAFPPQQNGIPLRSGWAADGVYSHENHGWYKDAIPSPEGPVTKFPKYQWQHRQFVRPSA
eukprot:jgi/Chrpa1/23721/Chrysochromulina_OHIO_Genome00000645-RA